MDKLTRYTEGFIEELKNSVDMVDLVSDYLELKRSGERYKGLCPFHNEKTPSFFVNPDNHFYHCFGCGAGGDVINFVMEIENITFSESIKLLAERAGIELPDLNDNQRRRYKEREKIFVLNKLTAKFFNYILLEKNMAKEARSYLEKRNFTKDDIKKFQLGYAADEWQMLMSFLKKREYSFDLMDKAGLITKGKNNSYYDKFRNRIMFPIFNNRGEVIAFGGRILDDQSNYGPKYLNSPETPIFSKKKNLYGMHLAKEKIRETGTCIIMEGYTDVIQAHKYGFENAIASLGTSFTEEQARLIKRYAENAYIAYDADTAGNKATLRGLEILSEAGIDVKVIELPMGSDPDQLLIKKGAEGFKKYMDNASSLVDFKINMIIKDKDLKDPGLRIKALKSIIDLISEISSELKREIYIERASEKTDFSKKVLSEEVKKKAKENKNRNSKLNIEKQNSQPKNLYAQLSYQQKIEEQILAYFINNPSLREKIANKITKKDFSGRTAQLADLLFKGKVISDSLKIDHIKEQLGEELLSYWSEIIVKQKKGLSEEKILKLADYLSSQRVSENKTKICSLLADEKLNLDKLNKLLLTFYNMNYNSERRD